MVHGWSHEMQYNDDPKNIKMVPSKHMPAHKHLHRDQHPIIVQNMIVSSRLRDKKHHDCIPENKRIYECIYCGCRFGDKHSCKWMGKRLFYGMDNESCLE